MEVWGIVALVCFAAGAVVAAVQRSWALALVAAGLAAMVASRVL